ncbi:hypothetical protein H2201_000363 [Coniosporium apollinis]|uniref:Uncharacterized protein n=1 Tax=Coniosporium apollinis TaxID=61459 RepID=A0ABQ9P4H7_9PEZI|nr:hypothetical protein H2201_000363 [Coniosporium apollinis]
MDEDHEPRPCPDCGGPPYFEDEEDDPYGYAGPFGRGGEPFGQRGGPFGYSGGPFERGGGPLGKVVDHVDATAGRSDGAVDLSDGVMDRLDKVVGRTDAIVGCSARVDRSGSVAVHLDGQNHLDTAVGRSSEAEAYSSGTEAHSGEMEGHSDDRGHLIGMVGSTDREGRIESMDRTDRAPGVHREHGSKTSWHTFAVVMAVSEATMAFLYMG